MVDIDVRPDTAFALIQRRSEDCIHYLEGDPLSLDALDQIPRVRGTASQGVTFDTISAVPFSQLKERGFEVHDDGAKIRCIRIARHARIPVGEFLATVVDKATALDGEVQYSLDRDDYEGVIRSVIEQEIGKGEGANFVIPRTARAKIQPMGPGEALAIFRRLVRNEFGSYWNFLFYDRDRYLIGATPEKHLHVYDGTVRMNPISGTLRKDPHRLDPAQFKQDLLAFLSDAKETNELFMVVDEELKMMAKLCSTGGMVIGPLLKEMSGLVHTEYLLSGRSQGDIIDLFRGSMFAATVTGSPVENACKVIRRYEPEARRYYGSALVLIGRDVEGKEFLDSPITIRTVEIDRKGNVLFRVGGTLVRDSDPRAEVLETESKIATILASLRGAAAPMPGEPLLPRFAGDDDINETLQRRNQHLSRFWFFLQDTEEDAVEKLLGKRVTIIDNEDDFCFMMGHMLERMGCVVSVIRFSEFELDHVDADVLVVGPGPGDPNDFDNVKMRRVAELVHQLLDSGRKFLAVCLGHQLLCLRLGLKVEKKRYPFQGTQEVIDLFGSKERVGFYNTFAARHAEIPGITAAYDRETGEVHALRGRNYVSFQFHAESILTKNGYQILKGALENLIADTDMG